MSHLAWQGFWLGLSTESSLAIVKETSQCFCVFFPNSEKNTLGGTTCPCKYISHFQLILEVSCLSDGALYLILEMVSSGAAAY